MDAGDNDQGEPLARERPRTSVPVSREELDNVVAVFEMLDRWAREADECPREGGGADAASEP